MFWSVCLVFVTWNGYLVLQRCWKTGVLVGLLGVCDMESVFGVTKVWGRLVIRPVCLRFVTWNGLFVLQRCCVSGGCVGC